MVAILLQVLSIAAGLCAVVYQIKAGITQNWKKQNIATLAWATGYTSLALLHFFK